MTRILLISLGSGALAFVLTLSRSWVPWASTVCALALLLWRIHAA